MNDTLRTATIDNSGFGHGIPMLTGDGPVTVNLGDYNLIITCEWAAESATT